MGVENSPTDTAETLEVNDLVLCCRTRSCWKAGTELHLTRTEFALLFALVRHDGEVVDKKTLKVEVWGTSAGITNKSLDVQISNLRKKVGPKLITSIWSRGFRLEIKESLAIERAQLRVGDLAIYPEAHRCWKAGTELHLTRTEFALLSVLARHGGEIVDKRKLKVEAWGADAGVADESLKVHINNLKKQIGPELIVNVRGQGYRLS